MKYSAILGLFEYLFQDMINSSPLRGGAHKGISDIYSI